LNVDFRLLGPVELVVEMEAAPLGGTRLRTLLAALVLRRNDTVPRDVLIDTLWDEAPPATAAHSLEVHVSRLRKLVREAGAGSRIDTHGTGYVLHADPDEVDVDRFVAAVEAGRTALAAGDPVRADPAFANALREWRGGALEGAGDGRVIRGERERLEELRLVATEDSLECALALARHESVIGDLRTLVTEHPLRERPRRLLMLALYRSGRQAEALEVFRDARRLLRDELGLDPSPELRELEQAILRQDPSIAAPAKPSRPAPSRPRRAATLAVVAGTVAVVAALVVAVAWLRDDGGSIQLDLARDAVGAFDESSGDATAAVPVGETPVDAAVGDNSLWVVNTDDHTVSRIDLATRTVRQTIRVGAGPSAIAYGAGAAWVANTLDGTVSRLDPSANEETLRRPACNSPGAIAVHRDRLWVACTDDRTIVELDAGSGEVVQSVPVAGIVRALAATPDGLWVADAESGAVNLVDPRTGRTVRSVSVGRGPVSLAIGFGSLWVANSTDGTVARVDPESGGVVSTIEVGAGASGLARGGDGIWAVSAAPGRLSRIDPRRNDVARAISIGGRPAAVEVTGGTAWVLVQAEGVAHRGGELRVVSHPPDSIDPGLAYEPVSSALLSLTNDGLLAFRRVGGSAGAELVPNLARALPVVGNGGRVFAFELRDGVRYSTGEEVRVEDFRRAIERSFELDGSPGQVYFAGLVGADSCLATPRHCDLDRGVIVERDRRRITFRLVRPDPEFPMKLAQPAAFAVPAATASRALARPVPATGPYRVAAYRPGRSLTLVRNDSFRSWSQAARPGAYPASIEWRFDEDPAAATRTVLSDRADVSLQRPFATDLERVLRTEPSRARFAPSRATFALFLDTRKAPFHDARVRRAVSFAVDRGRVARAAGGERIAHTTCQVLPPSFPGYRPYCPFTTDPETGAWSAPDLDKARRLLRAAGAAGSRVVVWSLPDWRSEVREVVRSLRLLGLDASQRIVSGSAYFEQVLNRRSAQAGLIIWFADYPAPSNFFRLFTCESARAENTSGSQLCNPALDQRIERAGRAQVRDPRAAYSQWAEVDRLLVDDAAWVPLFTPSTTAVLSDRVGNAQVHPQWGVLLDQLWVR
jgi:YVTN family beta-propeller protein